jgi:hypothetical protein
MQIWWNDQCKTDAKICTCMSSWQNSIHWHHIHRISLEIEVDRIHKPASQQIWISTMCMKTGLHIPTSIVGTWVGGRYVYLLDKIANHLECTKIAHWFNDVHKRDLPRLSSLQIGEIKSTEVGHFRVETYCLTKSSTYFSCHLLFCRCQ